MALGRVAAALRMREHHPDLTIASAQNRCSQEYTKLVFYLDKVARATVGARLPLDKRKRASEVSTPMAGTGGVARHARGELR